MESTQTARQQHIIEIIKASGSVSISQIEDLLNEQVSRPTLNRDLATLVSCGAIVPSGSARARKYSITDEYRLFEPIDPSVYFNLEPDNRGARTQFNFEVFGLLHDIELFTIPEKNQLAQLQKEYQQNSSTISDTLYKKELERLTIELSWKSSQIEGNTYSLLETERLLSEHEAAKDKTKEEARMLLNHKEAFEYLIDHGMPGKKLTLRFIEEVHSILIKDLGVSANIRSRGVGITGTAYKPLDNQHQIMEHLENMCSVVNSRANGFEKALLAVVLISYIQPFEDGNKRTGRMIGNALLIKHGACPLSYRSVDSLEYKKAMLLFYEQNNLSAFKQLFLEQNEFGVANYFQ